MSATGHIGGYGGRMSGSGHTPPAAGPDRVVVLVASLGGLAAISAVVAALPETFPVPVVVLQHGLRDSSGDALAMLLRRRTGLTVRTAEEGCRPLTPGVTVVASGRTATLGPDGLVVEGDARGGGGDGLLASAAGAVGAGVTAVVLTGRLDDGSLGVCEVKRRGGRVLVQDPTTAKAPGMPSSAVATGCVDFVLPLERIGAALVAICMAPGGAELLKVPSPSWARL